MGFGGGGGADDTGELREIKGAACLQLSWALAFPGSLPEPRRQDHKFGGYILPEEVVSTVPRDSPKEIPESMAIVLILFQELTKEPGKGGVALHW